MRQQIYTDLDHFVAEIDKHDQQSNTDELVQLQCFGRYSYRLPDHTMLSQEINLHPPCNIVVMNDCSQFHARLIKQNSDVLEMDPYISPIEGDSRPKIQSMLRAK